MPPHPPIVLKENSKNCTGSWSFKVVSIKKKKNLFCRSSIMSEVFCRPYSKSAQAEVAMYKLQKMFFLWQVWKGGKFEDIQTLVKNLQIIPILNLI